MDADVPMGESMDEYIGIPIKRAAEIIGTTRARLIGWGEAGILRPKAAVWLGAQVRWLYTLDELATGRIIRQIEESGIDIRHLTWLVGKYRDDAHPNPLLTYVWGVDEPARKVYLSDDNGSTWLDGEKPNHYVMPTVINVEEILAQVRAEATARRGRAGHSAAKRGRQVFEGTRVPVSAVLSWIEAGASDERILEAYPSIEVADIQAVRAGTLRAS